VRHPEQGRRRHAPAARSAQDRHATATLSAPRCAARRLRHRPTDVACAARRCGVARRGGRNGPRASPTARPAARCVPRRLWRASMHVTPEVGGPCAGRRARRAGDEATPGASRARRNGRRAVGVGLPRHHRGRP
jgi:hypothetical protein